MSIVCPHCRHGFVLKEPKAGRYKPKCPKCQQRFLLTIFADPSRPPATEPLPSETPEATLPPSPVAPASPATKTSVSRGLDETIAQPPTSPASPAETFPPTNPGGSLAATIAPPATSSITATTAGAQPTVGFDATVALDSARAHSTAIEVAAATPGSSSMLPTLGGYRLIRELGRGAMGAVYLARQLSLDREVAVKTIQGEWAQNPVFIARFTREAYAAAQLTHHNVVQIYDMGIDREVHFFSMEYVRGQSLDGLVKQHGKLEPEVALGFALQAARGLQYAHSRGLVHRDVKPANLMLSEHGVVKVADLGLVKSVGDDEPPAGKVNGQGGANASALSQLSAKVTAASVAMGTPAYMAPEQAENAAGVDHRADIYSLGCTLYVLLTGRPPFEGSSALEVITKHRTEPVVRPEMIVRRLPQRLSDITLKMVAKKPEDRFQHLGEAIQAMEDALGIQSANTFSPSEAQVQAVETAAQQFQAAPTARLRRKVILGFFAALSALLVLSLPFSFTLAGMFLCLLVLTPLTYFVLSGWLERTYLFDKARQLVLTARLTDWLTAAVGLLLALVVVWLLGLLGTAISVSLLAVGLAAGMYFYFDRKLAAERRPALDEMQALIKSLRIKGYDEQALRQFVARYSGESWEEFFESLFGYEAKLTARAAWGKNEQGRPRRKFRAWRDTVVRAIDDRLHSIQEARDRKLLQQIEEKNLQAQGLDLISARKQAQRVADALVEEAAEIRHAVVETQPTAVDPKVEAIKKRARIKTMLADARSGQRDTTPRATRRNWLAPLGWFFGPKARFLVGGLLLVGCLLWANQNGLLTREHAETIQSAVTEGVQNQSAQQVAENLKANLTAETTPLNLPVVGQYFTKINPGIAGLVLIFSSLFRGIKMTLFAAPAAAVMVAAPVLNLPDIPVLPLTHALGLAVGAAIAVVGFFFGRTYD